MAGSSTPFKKRLLRIRVLTGTGVVVLFAFAFIRFFHPAGLGATVYWWLMIVAMGLGVLGFSVFTAWQRAGLVAATFLTGFGAQLALKYPFWFQPIRIDLASHVSYLMLAAPFLQGVTAALILSRNGILRRGVEVLADLGWIRCLSVLLVLFSGSIGAMDYIAKGKYGNLFEQLFTASAFLVLNISSFIALILAAPDSGLRKLHDLVTRAICLPQSGIQTGRFDKLFPFWLAGGVFVVCVFIRIVVFEGIPRIDEILYLFQAKYFVQGQLALPLPPSVEAFGTYLMDTHDGKWFAVVMPGWPLVLSIGVFLDMSWIVNPLLAAASILLLHSFVLEMTDRGTANLTILLMSVSPWYVYMSSTLMPHTVTYALILGAWLLLIRTWRRPSLMMPLAAGALMGLVFLTRAYDGILMGGLTGLWTLSFLRDRTQWKTVLLYGMGCAAIGGLIFPYNAYLTGDPFLTPLNNYLNELWGMGANRIGFGPDIGPPDWGSVDPFRGHSPYEALLELQQMFYALNFELLGWGVGSITFALFFVFWGKLSRFTASMMVIVVVIVGAYFLYWFGAAFYVGPRYWFSIIVPMFVLSAAGITACIEKFDRIFPEGLVPQRVSIGIAFLCLCSVLVFWNWLGFNKYPGFGGYHDNYRTLAKQERFKNSLIFVAADSLKYRNAFWLNDFSAAYVGPLFARDLGMDTNRRVASAYPEREIYFVKTSVNNHDSEFVRGPLSLDDLE